MTDWNEIRDMLNHEIHVCYTHDNEVNRRRDNQKAKTVEWIIERMQLGFQPGGTRVIPPEYSYVFGDLWKPVSRAVKMAQPQCYLCRSAPTTEIHHIRPKFLKGSLYDPRNLVGLCSDCHDELHRVLNWSIDRLLEKSLEW